MAVIAASGTVLSITSADASTVVPLWSPTTPGVYSATLVFTLTTVGTDGALHTAVMITGTSRLVESATGAGGFDESMFPSDYTNGEKWAMEIEPWVEPTGSEFELGISVAALYDGDVSVEWWVVQVSALA